MLVEALGRGLWRRRARAPGRTPAQVREHYLIERSLAERLRTTPRAERAAAYAAVYDELFRSIPHHPQLLARCSGDFVARRRRSVEYQWRFVKRFVAGGDVFMEIGAGDCALSARAAATARHVYAVDVSDEITRDTSRPANLELRLTAGAAIPVPSGAVQVAFSNQLMEHLHPDDALDQLCEIWRSLSSGGVYVCITPNRLSGPHDISAHFDDEATGLHLREYSARELRALFYNAGFRRLDFFAGARGWYVRLPYVLIALAERLLESLPGRLRKALARLAPARALLGLRVAAVK
jgi:SAM-dependent methyltransferase